MSEEEIKKLSRELAEALYGEDYMFASWSKSLPVACKASELKVVLKIILRDFCIVPKSTIKELDIVYRVNTYNLVALSRPDVIKLFGSDLFEQKGE